MNQNVPRARLWVAAGLSAGLGLTTLVSVAQADIAATHVYHNHMPNFWAYFDPATYAPMSVGAPLRYTYDGQVIDLKESPPANYPYYLPDGQPMPHDDLVSYYSHHAKIGAYMTWPWDTATQNRSSHPLSTTQVTMSGSVVTNVQSINALGNVSGYSNPSWGQPWRSTYDGVKTSSGERALDLIHFTGHHSMGPLVGDSFFLKELIYHGAILAQSYFLGDSYRSSKGFFPTELGFSERLIPVLQKMGITWSVVANVHLSRTLRDYPYLNDPGKDTLTSPPNRADLQNTSTTGSWVSEQMFNEQQVTQNKFPFASIPHYAQYVDPTTGAVSRVAAIPVEQASSWEEGYQGSVTADLIKPFEDEAAGLGRVQYFVIAHDGDNASGRAGDGGTWLNSGRVTYSDEGVTGKGVAEYLKAHPIPTNDVVHVQDGSWIDTRDSSADPTWYHWHLPFGIWKGQFADFNRVMGTSYAPKKNLDGVEEGMTVSLEYGYHYLERNFALLQAAQNYAETAEQIWLDAHPNHWRPTTTTDRQITYDGNQLNPWMMSLPVKGDASRDWAGGANPAELAWFFLLPAMDSGFGYYDENVDDHLKPTLSFNNSLDHSQPYVDARLAQDHTGPSVWWPQRWPYNPGSANVSKAEGWTLHYFDPTFALYTYVYDVSGLNDVKVKVRVHRDKVVDPLDKTCRVYDPQALDADPLVDPTKVGAWVSYPMKVRDLEPDKNGVDWQASTQETMAILPAREIGDLYYTYLDAYRDQLLDYYVEATDARGNVTRSPIQQVYVGAGRYTRRADGKLVEDLAGAIEGTYPFVTDKAPTARISTWLEGLASTTTLTVETRVPGGAWEAGPTLGADDKLDVFYRTDLSYTVDHEGLDVRYRLDGGALLPSAAGVRLSAGTFTVYRDGTVSAGAPEGLTYSATVYYRTDWATPYMHWRPAGGTWTTVPGTRMLDADIDGYAVLTVDLGAVDTLEAVFNNGSGTWDNNGSKNYLFPAGVSTLTYGAITEGEPEPVSPPEAGAFVTVYYVPGYTAPWIHYRTASGAWTTPPGEAMPRSAAAGYFVKTVPIGALPDLECVFNNGSGTWDNNGGRNYHIAEGTWTFQSGNLTAAAPLPMATCCVGERCFETTAEGCDQVDGVFGAAPTPTALPDGSCCLDGGCQALDSAACAAANGAWGGAGSTCAAATCATPTPTAPVDPLGACCTRNSCELSPLTMCVEGGGDFQGADTSCDEVECSAAGCATGGARGGHLGLGWVGLALAGAFGLRRRRA